MNVDLGRDVYAIIVSAVRLNLLRLPLAMLMLDVSAWDALDTDQEILALRCRLGATKVCEDSVDEYVDRLLAYSARHDPITHRDMHLIVCMWHLAAQRMYVTAGSHAEVVAQHAGPDVDVIVVSAQQMMDLIARACVGMLPDPAEHISA